MVYSIALFSFGTIFFFSLGIFYLVSLGFIDNPVKKRLKSLSGDIGENADETNLNVDEDLTARLKEEHAFGKNNKKFTFIRFWAALLEQAGLQCTVAKFFLVILLLYLGSLLCFLVFKFPLWLFPAPALGLIILSVMYLLMRKKKRTHEFNTQLPDCLSLISNVLRAGLGLTAAMEVVGKEMPEPSCVEFHKTVAEMHLGLDLKTAMEHFSQRIHTPEVSLFTAAILLQSEVGGNLAEFLDKLQETIRNRSRLKRELITLTAQVKISSRVVSLVPFLLAIILFLMNGEYMNILFKSPTGHIMIVLGIILQISGFLIMKKMSAIEI